MIRSLEPTDLPAVSSLWLDANQEAHGFIPVSYWLGHLEEVRSALAQAEVYVFVEEDRSEILGFLGLQGDYVAGIFVRREAWCCGVGRRLLDHVKGSHPRLCLRVYERNPRAAAFYRREGFRVLEEGVDPETGEREFLMEWRRGDLPV